MTANPRSMYRTKSLLNSPCDTAGTTPRSGRARPRSWSADRSRDRGVTPRYRQSSPARLRAAAAETPLSRCGQQSFEDGDEIEQLLRVVIAEIVDPVGNRIRGRAIMRRERTRDDVVDVGEVARHPALVEDPDRFTCQDRASE